MMTRLRSFGSFLMVVACVAAFSFAMWNMLIADTTVLRPNGLLAASGFMGLIFGGILWCVLTPPTRHEPLPGVFGRIEAVIGKYVVFIAAFFLSMVLIYTAKPTEITDALFLSLVASLISAGGWIFGKQRTDWLKARENATGRVRLAVKLQAALQRLLAQLANDGMDVRDFHALNGVNQYLSTLIHREGSWPEPFRAHASGWVKGTVVQDPRVSMAIQATGLLLAEERDVPVVEPIVEGLIQEIVAASVGPITTEQSTSVH